MRAPQKIHVRVIDATSPLFEDDALSITSVNKTGVFDILPKHADFVCIIQDYLKINLGDKKTYNKKIKSGVLKCINGKVDIFLGLDTLSH